MSLFLPLKRATLLIPSGPQGDQDRKHLFILLTDPHADQAGKNCVLMVSLSTVRPGMPHDPTCILYAGDHPFVKHESYVVYQKARLRSKRRTKYSEGSRMVSLWLRTRWMAQCLPESVRAWKTPD